MADNYRYPAIYWKDTGLYLQACNKFAERSYILSGKDDIPNIYGCPIGSSPMEWLAEHEPNYKEVLSKWGEELTIYKQTLSQVNLPVKPVSTGTRGVTYTLHMSTDSGILSMEVEVRVSYRDLGKSHVGVTLSLLVTDDEEQYTSKAMVSYYPIRLPVDMDTIRTTIAPGIAYLAREVSNIW